MDIMESKPTFYAMHSSADSFTKFPNDNSLIQKLPILMNIKKEIPDTEHEYDNLINPSKFSNYRTQNLVNIKTAPDSIKSEQCDNTEIFSETSLLKISDAKDSTELDLNLLSTPFIKNNIKFSSDEALIQKLPILMNIKKEISDIKLENDNLFNSLEFSDYQAYNLVNIKTDPDSIQSLKCDNTEIFLKSSLSKIYDAKDSVKLDLNNLSTAIIKHESMDIKVKTHDSDPTPMTTDLETSLISIKDENFGELEDFEDASCDENLSKFRDTFSHICKTCNKTFVCQENLKRHELTVHLKINHAKCTYCDKSFTKIGYLKNHEERVHLKIRDWKCNLCDKYFTKKSNLKRHEETIHLKVKNASCSHCNKSFTQKGSLKIHVKTVHLKIREWKCNFCDKCFPEKHNLKRHENTVHLKIRDWKCNLCDKRLTEKRLLKRHEETVHLKIRDWKCNLCDKHFTQKGSLKRHKQAVHLKNWQCNICEKSFAKKVNLDSHSRVHSIDLS